jgi:hypothetical protein
MISTRFLISDISEVPSVWAFEYYCNLSEKLVGQQLKMTSMFNPTERTPSFVLYCNEGSYLFNDFSTGRKGNFVKLVSDLYGLEYFEAILKIIQDYNTFLLQNNGDYSVGEFKKHSKYEVTEYVVRTWNNLDAKFWTDFCIDSDTLNHFNVVPLEKYVMEKRDDGETDGLVISGQYIYGYLREDKTLYKIYQPKVKEHKFLKIKNYVQGTDQLEFNKPNLVICSSLKDAMCLKKFGYNVELVAPDSENTAIRREVIDIYKIKYKSICTLFDNDEAGIKAMQKYKDNFSIPYVHLKLEKDLSDSVKTYGVEGVRKFLHPLLKEALKK